LFLTTGRGAGAHRLSTVSKICAAAVEPRDGVRDQWAFGVCHGDAQIFGACRQQRRSCRLSYGKPRSHHSANHLAVTSSHRQARSVRRQTLSARNASGCRSMAALAKIAPVIRSRPVKPWLCALLPFFFRLIGPVTALARRGTRQRVHPHKPQAYREVRGAAVSASQSFLQSWPGDAQRLGQFLSTDSPDARQDRAICVHPRWKSLVRAPAG
jgi:hypothetical protein